MKNCRKPIRKAILGMLSAAMLLTAVPGYTLQAAGEEVIAADTKKMSEEELYQIDGGDAEYWKYYDAEGNPVVRNEEQTLLAENTEEEDEVTITSPYTGKDYSVKSGYQITHAIDVSKWNNQNTDGAIDWNQVKKDGIESVIIRCAYRGYGDAGTLSDDPYFKENIEGALAAGLKVGVYVYSQAINEEEAVEEASKCLTLCENYLDQMSLPIVMDTEYASNEDGTCGRLYDANLTRAEQTTVCRAFCETIEDAGYYAMVYANKSMLSNNMNPSDITDAGYKIWLARYNSYAGYTDSPYLMWQYSSSGSVSGIDGNVDVNFVFTSFFEDVSEYAYYFEPVQWAYKKGIAQGVDDTHFAPEETCTRGQVVTFLWRAAGKPEASSAQCSFVDIDPNAYYYDAILWAYENGITDGVDDTHFDPDAFVTRGQFVTFLHRAMGEQESSLTSSPFSDVTNGTYYYDAVLWAYERGITDGVDNTHFGPSQSCTRGQVVTFLYRAYQ